jgi:hypothetical protein
MQNILSNNNFLARNETVDQNMNFFKQPMGNVWTKIGNVAGLHPATTIHDLWPKVARKLQG